MSVVANAKELTGADSIRLPTRIPHQELAQRPEVSNGVFVLPNDHQPITKAAQEIFSVIGPTHTLFTRGRIVMELRTCSDGLSLEILKPERFRSLLESYDRPLCAWKTDKGGELVLKPKNCPDDSASALLATREASELLPPVRTLVNAPVFLNVDGGKILGKGYHGHNGGILVVKGGIPPTVPIGEGVAALEGLLEEFEFQSKGDRARALAAFITPALKIGGYLKESIPLDVAEADCSQSGKTYRQKLIRTVYRETAYPIAAKNGGVGSLDESISAALISGRPFIAVDNLRGKIDSQFLEMILTWNGPVPARVPHRGEVEIDASSTTFQLSSNGAETTRDLANRSSIVRIRKRPGHTFKDFAEGKLIDHVASNQPYYLGCVFAIILEWLRLGRPTTKETRHDFREWAGTLDHICGHILLAGPLLDGHQSAQERVSNPALTWLRRVALAIVENGQAGFALAAHQIYNLCQEGSIETPGLKLEDEEAGPKVIGRIMARCFGESNQLEIDHLSITKTETDEPNSNRQTRPVKRYSVNQKCNLQPMQHGV